MGSREMPAAESCMVLSAKNYSKDKKEHGQIQNLPLVKLHGELLILTSKQEKSCSFLKYLELQEINWKRASRLSCGMALMGHFPAAY